VTLESARKHAKCTTHICHGSCSRALCKHEACCMQRGAHAAPHAYMHMADGPWPCIPHARPWRMEHATRRMSRHDVTHTRARVRHFFLKCCRTRSWQPGSPAQSQRRWVNISPHAWTNEPMNHPTNQSAPSVRLEGSMARAKRPPGGDQRSIAVVAHPYRTLWPCPCTFLYIGSRYIHVQGVGL